MNNHLIYIVEMTCKHSECLQKKLDFIVSLWILTFLTWLFYVQHYRQDCETFRTVVKMLVDKEPSLDNLLQAPLDRNLLEIKDRCLDALRHFVKELDEVLKPDTTAWATGHKTLLWILSCFIFIMFFNQIKVKVIYFNIHIRKNSWRWHFSSC